MARVRTRPPSRGRALLRLGILAGLLIGAAIVWWKFGPTDLQSLRALARRARSMRDTALAGPSFVLVYVAASALGLPITPLTLLSGVIFGTVLGATLSWTGAVGGAAVGFLLARRLGAEAVRTLAGERAAKIDELSERTGFLTLLRLQLIPILPLGALNLACGVAGVRLWLYVGAAAIGVIPGSVIYAYFADRVIAGTAGAGAQSRAQIIVASLLLIALTFLPTAASSLRRRLRRGAR